MEKKKVKKFKLFKNYRYLAGLVSESQCMSDLKQYNKHRYKVCYFVGKDLIQATDFAKIFTGIYCCSYDRQPSIQDEPLYLFKERKNA